MTSVRHVDWEDSRSGGFMFVFRPGALERAPHTFVGFVHGPAAADARARLQYDLVSRYPNVSAIDGRDVIARIQTVVDNVVLAISIVGGIALVSGVLILIGAVAMTKFQRVYEAAILRTLGASTRLLTTMVALEYSALGLLAGLIGAGGALALSWAVARYLLRHRLAARATPAPRWRRLSRPRSWLSSACSRAPTSCARSRWRRSGRSEHAWVRGPERRKKSVKIEFCRARQKGACGEEAWSSRIRMRFSGSVASFCRWAAGPSR